MDTKLRCYIVELRNAPGEPRVVETVIAADDHEAQKLAVIRLACTVDFRMVRLWDEDRLAGFFVRDRELIAPSAPLKGATAEVFVR